MCAPTWNLQLFDFPEYFVRQVTQAQVGVSECIFVHYKLISLASIVISDLIFHPTSVRFLFNNQLTVLDAQLFRNTLALQNL